MRARSMVVALAMLCGFLAWRLMARQAAQQPSVVLRGGAMVATDRDIQLLRQGLRATGTVTNSARSMMRNIVWSGSMESNGPR